MLYCSEAGIWDWGLGSRESETRFLIFRIPNPESRIASATRGARR
ncbi:hypothetical protein [Lysobacter gummosus]